MVTRESVAAILGDLIADQMGKKSKSIQIKEEI